MSEKNSGFMNGHPLYNNSRKASWDGDTMDIEIKDKGDAMTISLGKEDLIDLLGRSCHKTPLDKRLKTLLTSRKKTCKRKITSPRKTRRSTVSKSKTRKNTSHTRRKKTNKVKQLLQRHHSSDKKSGCWDKSSPTVVASETCYA